VASPDDDDSGSKSLLPKLSRRALFTGAGASALSASLAHSVAEAAATASPAVLGPGPSALSLSINDRAVTVHVDPAVTLAEVLRNHLGMTGTKIGCDRGACSACTVWLDGEVAASCMTLAFDARGRKVTTIEGLARGDELHPVQRAFVESDAMQCGFCTPGMVMSCAALVERNPKCTLDDVKQAVSGHLCRCGTYPNVFKATLAAAKSSGKKGRKS
jgi:carbon-monoxide dehydrogenase small subunit/xanthine dehydrogenase YagT iron-sulfur-binding subunit